MKKLLYSECIFLMKLEPVNQDHNCRMKPPLPPDPSDEPYMEQQQHPAKRAAELSPTSIDRPRETPATSDFLPTQIDLRALESQKTTGTEG